MEKREVVFGKHKIILPKNIEDSINGISCLLIMQGYDVKYRSSTAPRKSIYKGREIESDFRLKISFKKNRDVINISLAEKDNEITGIHISSMNGNDYSPIFPEDFDNINKILMNRIKIKK